MKHIIALFLVVGVFLFLMSCDFTAFGTTSITLSKNTGDVGDAILVSGTGFTPTTQSQISFGLAFNQAKANLNGNVWLVGQNSEDTWSLPAGSHIFSVGIPINTVGIGSGVASYGTGFSTPENSLVNVLRSVPGQSDGGPFLLPPGGQIVSVGVPIGVEAGWIDVKIYNASAGDFTGFPTQLLGDSGPQQIKGSGIQNFSLTVTIPKTGWVYPAYEFNSSAASVETGSAARCIFAVGHTFSQNSPNPFGSSTETCPNDFPVVINYVNPTPFVRVKIYNASVQNGNPTQLLGESGQIQLNNTGLNYFPVSATVGPSGFFYAAYEFSSSVTAIDVRTPATFGGCFHSHVFGSGPNPFPLPLSTCQNSWDFPSAINYSNTLKLINFTWDGSIINSIPSTIITNSTGGFSSATIIVPSSTTINPHVLNGSDGINSATKNFDISIIDPQFSMWLSDNSAQIMTGKIIQSYSGGTSTQSLNGTGWASFNANAGQQYNYTFIDGANNFVIRKLINNSTTTGFTDNQPTWETPINCVGAHTGMLSDFVIQVNDTDGTHMTGLNAKCNGQNQLLFNATFTANGQSPNNYASIFRLPVANSLYYSNPSSATINGTTVQTSFTQGNNIISNSYSVGNGLINHLLKYIINLSTGATNGGQSGGVPQLYTTQNPNCFAGVFNPLTNECQFGPIGVNATSQPVVVNTSTSNTTTINIQCQGAPYLTITNVNLGSNPLGFQIVGLPTTVNCGQNTGTPSTCPQGSTLQNGQCISAAICPLSSQLSNGQCVGPLTCPTGANEINGQCIIPATCSGGTQPVNGICQVNGTIIVQAPPTNSSQSCGLTNPLACVTGSSQSEPATLTGVAPNGQSVAVNTVLTSVTNPELNNVSIIMIGLIIAAAIGGAVYRYVLKKEKSSSRKPRKSSGKKGNIEKFNSNLRKK